MIDIGFFYVDLGRPWWRGAVDNMVATARATQPGCRVRHYGDAPTGAWPGTDDATLAAERIDATILMAAKAFMWGRAGQEAQRNTVLTDADMDFRRDMAPLFDGDWDVGLLWRQTGQVSVAQPYLAAMALTKPTAGARAFWKQYADVAGNLPKAWHAWWVDQVALGVVLGTVHHRDGIIAAPDFKVKLFPVDGVAPKVEKPGCYAVHFKGMRAEKKAA